MAERRRATREKAFRIRGVIGVHLVRASTGAATIEVQIRKPKGGEALLLHRQDMLVGQDLALEGVRASVKVGLKPG